MKILCNKLLWKVIPAINKHKSTLHSFCANDIINTSFSQKDIDIINPSGVISKSHTCLSEE